ncbi:MAG: alpha-amylase family glycosyl hydrolase [Paludibacteraceae bacterium]|nr:alpha-amylase family glycosyl hydrolase [Paludibacteraceae bacterium]
MKATKILLSVIALAMLMASCGKNNPVKPTENWDTPVSSIGVNNRVIYEVNVRNFSKEGNFAGVTAQLDRLYKLGVDIIWLMPIHPIGIEGHNGSIGSPYAVRNYMEVNSDYGTIDDFKNLVSAAHSKGMKVWMDWVPNHTAMDHPWVKDHPEYYAGSKPYHPTISGVTWADVYQLDMKKEATYKAMTECMKYWVGECDIDGFRFDYASSNMIANDFWVYAKAELSKIKSGLEWLAEADCSVDNESLLANFDFDYAWGFNDKITAFAASPVITDLQASCQELFNNKRYTGGKAKMVYVTNHDLNADSGTEFTRFGRHLANMTVLSFTIYDMPLIYNGQEIGDDQHMNLFDKQTIWWGNTNDGIQTLIKKLCRLKRTTKALASGAERGSLYIMPTEDIENLFSYKRTNGESEVVVVMNFSGKSVTSQFAGSVPQGKFRDYLDGGDVEFSSDPTFTVPAYGCKIFRK